MLDETSQKKWTVRIVAILALGQVAPHEFATTYLHHIPELLDFAKGWDEFARATCPEDHRWYAPIHQQWGEH